MGSSYKTVADLLMKTKEFDTVRRRVVQRLEEARYDKMHFVLYEDTRSADKTFTKIDEYFDLHISDKPYRINANLDTINALSISWYHLISDEDVVDTIASNFGTDRCRTYNCSRDKVRAKFTDYAREALAVEVSDQKRAAEERLREDLKRVLRVERDSLYLAFRDRQAIEAIKAAVRKFPVTKEVVKAALDEYIVEHVLLG